MRDRLARLLYALGARIERRPAAHRANNPALTRSFSGRPEPVLNAQAMQDLYECGESWASTGV